ncbi:MAG: ABC transporter ATP-binding protein [Clostridia bacterium]|nr:ABC transporter ATP-binding protein [Clostridia bacterium]
MEIIKTENLTKYYGKARGIIDVGLSIEAGECFGFIGPNGAGKSTTIRTLLGLISATSGSAYIFGKDIVKEKREILQNVGYLPSEATFYSGMKVKDILKLSADLRGTDCSAEANKLCERLRLDTGANVDELSFGNRKKVAIVCAFQSKPDLLILDEPTGGLDPLMQHEFFEIIRERNRKGATVFLSSHILSEVQRNCTRAAVIREGRIIACDSVEMLAKSNAKRVSVSGGIVLDGLEGVRDVKTADGRTSFLYSGDINLLVRRLSGVEIADLTITEPDLDEVFMHYYEKEG